MRCMGLVLLAAALQLSSALQVGLLKNAQITRRSLVLSLPALSVVPSASLALEAISDPEVAISTTVTSVAEPPVAEPPVAEVPAVRRTSISYEDLSRLLVDCKDSDDVCNVERVAFTVASGESGDVFFTNGDRVPITGIPQENPNNDSSPYKLIAKLRDARVRYTFPFSDTLAKYRKQ